jgi:SAM-dependent methyltransferase
MMHRYDEHYQDLEDFYGEPEKELVALAQQLQGKKKVLDLGCGQGKDILYLAELRHDVTGIDISSVAINQMLTRAEVKGLQVKGIVGDVIKYQIKEKYDLILLVGLLHFTRGDENRRMILERVENSIVRGGYCFIAEHPIAYVLEMFEQVFLQPKWTVLENKIQTYDDGGRFRVYIVKWI